jgi:hypothetical protein
MEPTSVAAVLLAACVLSGEPDKRPADTPDPLKGVVRDGKLWTCYGDGQALVVNCTPLAGGDPTVLRGCAASNWDPPRWQIGHGCLWAAVSDKGQLANAFSTYNGFHRYHLDELAKDRLVTGPGAKDEKPDAPFAFSSPLEDIRDFARDAEFEWRLHYDYLSVSSGRVLLFALSNVRGKFVDYVEDGKKVEGSRKLVVTEEEKTNPQWSLTVYDFTGAWDAKEKQWKSDRAWQKVETIDVGFREPFQVLEKGGDYYFVTSSGRLYRAPPCERDQPRLMKSVWDDAKRPIVAFLTDADAGKTYVFCAPEKKGEKAVYFELGEKAEPVPYNLETVPAFKPNNPASRLLGYARILTEDKKNKTKE